MAPIEKDSKRIPSTTAGTGAFAHKKEAVPEIIKSEAKDEKNKSYFVIIGGEEATITKIKKRLGKTDAEDEVELREDIINQFPSVEKSKYKFHPNGITISITFKTANLDETKDEVISFFKKLEKDGVVTINDIKIEDVDRIYFDVVKKTKIEPVLVEVSAVVNGESMDVASLYLHLREMMLAERGIRVEYESNVQADINSRKDMTLRVSSTSIDEGKKMLGKALKEAFSATKLHYAKTMGDRALAHIDDGFDGPGMHFSIMKIREEAEQK